MTRAPAAAGGSRQVLLLAYAGAVAALTGVQLITPALPDIQRALELSDSQVGLVTSLYLLPGVLFAVPIGLITDRVGRRAVYSGAMVLMGGGGIVLLFVHDLTTFFIIRLLQGVAFAAILPITITMIGDVVSGRELVRAQGRRNIAMAAGDAGLPLVGGLLVGVAWFAPFAVQLITIPLAILGWRLIGHGAIPTRRRPSVRALGRLLRDPLAIAIQAAGLLRFLFKFALLSYLPILLAGRGAPTLLIAVSLSAIAVAGIVSAWIAPSIIGWLKPSLAVAACLVTMSATLAAIALVDTLGIAIVAMLLFGFADVLYGVLPNAAMVTAVPGEARASFVAAIGAVRNFGKFAAPSVVGVLLLGMRLEHVYLVLAVLALVAVPTALPLRTIDDALRASSTGEDATA